MSKKNALDFDSAKEQLVEVKTNLKELRGDMKTFLKENKLKRGVDHSEHETKKVARGWTKINKAITAAEAKVGTLRDFVKENKPKKDRVSKYEYPEGLDADGRKKFRTQMRAKAKRAGMTPDEFLADPEAGEKVIAEKDAEKATKKAAKAEKKPKADKKDKKDKKDKEDKKTPKPKKRPKKSKADDEDED